MIEMKHPKKGDRVRITGRLPQDPDPLPIGLEGTVKRVFDALGPDMAQFDVDWDTDNQRPRMLMLLPGDPFEIL